MADGSSTRRLHALQSHLNTTRPAMPPTQPPITSHVLDTALGRPAAGVPMTLYRRDAATPTTWHLVNGGARTNADGRVDAATPLIPAGVTFVPGTYKLVFDTAHYFAAQGQREFFYPDVTITFIITDSTQHYHVPLLISPFGFSTYRGS